MTTDLIPPVRLGKILRHRREELGWTMPELAELHGLSATDLDAIESGLCPLDEATVAMIGAVYGVDADEIAPLRSELIIDVGEGTIAIAERKVSLDEGEPGEILLSRYLALVHTLRDVPVGTPVPLRQIDVDVLALALERNAAHVEEELLDLMGNPSEAVTTNARRFKKSLMVPLAGLLVGVTAVGGLVMVRSAGDAGPIGGGGPSLEISTTAPVVASVPAVDIGEPVTLERDSVPRADLGVEIGEAVTLERE